MTSINSSSPPPSQSPTPSQLPTPSINQHSNEIDGQTCINFNETILKPPAVKDEAKSKCMELAEKIKQIEADTELKKAINKTVADAANIFISTVNPLVGLATVIGNNISAKNELHTQVITSINQAISSLNSIQVSNECNNIDNSIQSNIISDTKECLDYKTALTTSTCGTITDVNQRINCVGTILDKFNVSRINMSNKNTIKQTCSINSAINQIAANSNDTTLQAIMKVLQTASGPVTTNSNSSLNCTEINTNVNAESYTNAVSCCLNKISKTQLNSINKCGMVNDVTLNNTNDSMNDCLLGLNVLTNTNNNNSSKLDIFTELMQKVDNNMLAIGGISSCVICICSILILSIIALPMIQSVLEDNTTD